MSDAASWGVLLDGALLRGHRPFADFSQRGTAIALYGDMGAEAASVGPWFISNVCLSDLGVRDWPLPERLGASEVHARCSLAKLQSHLLSIRTVLTTDNSSFYLRFADMRALAAMLTALGGASASRRRLLGPIESWSFVDRAGMPTEVLSSKPEHSWQFSETSQPPLGLTDTQLDRLEVASLADRLASAVEELDDRQARPQHHAEQFALVEAAAAFVQGQGIESFVAQRAIARKTLNDRGAALQNPQFASALHSLVRQIDAEPAILAWRDDPITTTQRKAVDAP